MGTTRTIAAASLAAVLLVGACGGDDSPSSSGTTAGGSGATTSSAAPTTVATTTTRSPEALKAALLQPGDIPGATPSASSGEDADLSACFPGNPLGAKTDPSEVDSQDLDVTAGGLQRSYASSARVGTPEQARSFVTTFGSAAGSACALNAFKAEISAPPDPVDASGLTGKPSSVAVGDAGSLLTITGSLRSGGRSAPVAIEVLTFHKGPVVVMLFVGAFGGQLVAGQGVELARKIAGRLS